MCCSSPFFFDWNSWLKPRTCAIAWPPRIATHRDLNRKWMCSRSIDPHCVFVYYFFSPHIFFIYNNTIINNIFLSNRKQKYFCLSKHHFHQVNHVLFCCWQQSTGLLLLRGAEGLEWVFGGEEGSSQWVNGWQKKELDSSELFQRRTDAFWRRVRLSARSSFRSFLLELFQPSSRKKANKCTPHRRQPGIVYRPWTLSLCSLYIDGYAWLSLSLP